VALGIAAVATLIPAIRAARTSTVAALADAARPPHRSKRLINASARLPVPLLLGLRLAARRPRRTLLNVASIAVTASGIVTMLCVYAGYGQSLYASSGLADPQTGKLNRVLLVFAVALVALAAVNAILITWATVLDTRRPSALIRALGATPEQVSVGLAVAQALPALVGALLGIPGGIELFAVIGKDGTVTVPSAWWLIATVLGAVAGVVAAAIVPSWLGTRRTTAGILQSEAG
jgi:putative ABC transport system permease protein